MTDRRVTQSRKDQDGDITALCNSGESWWSPRLKAAAISDIKTRVHSYYVLVDGKRVEIEFVNGPTGQFLRTVPDSTTRNNLDNLPDC